MMQTEYDFTLPKGYVDENGVLHRTGKMRLATAGDEIYSMRDPRVQQHPEYMMALLLPKVITELGTIRAINEALIEKLFITDFEFLQDLYSRINRAETPVYDCQCPSCGESVKVPVNFQQEG